MKRNRALRDDLRAKENENRNIRIEFLCLDKRIRILEQLLQQRNAELSDIYKGALHQEEKIALLEKTFGEMVSAEEENLFSAESEDVTRSDTSSTSDSVTDSNGPGPSTTASQPVQFQESANSSKGKSDNNREKQLWRKELNSILDVLDSIDK